MCPRIFGYQITTADVLYGPITLADNQSSPATAVTYPLSGNNYIQITYGLTRNGMYTTGEIYISCDGNSIVSISDDNTETADLGISFDAIISGSNLIIQYTTTATGHSGTMTYYQKAW